jgi:hypothetical protein
MRDVCADGRSNGDTDNRTHCCADEIADARSNNGADCCSFCNTNGGSVCNTHQDPYRLSDVAPHVRTDHSHHRGPVCDADRTTIYSTDDCAHRAAGGCPYDSAYDLSDVHAFRITHDGAFREANKKSEWLHRFSEPVSKHRSDGVAYHIAFDIADSGSHPVAQRHTN